MSRKRTSSQVNEQVINKKRKYENVGLEMNDFDNYIDFSQNQFIILMQNLYYLIKKRINLYEIKKWLYDEINKTKQLSKNDLRSFYDIINTYLLNYYDKNNKCNDVARALLLFDLNAVVYSSNAIDQINEIINFLLITRKVLIKNAKNLHLLKENESELV
jgi:hypothetical protein